MLGSVPDVLPAFLMPWKTNYLLIHANTSGALPNGETLTAVDDQGSVPKANCLSRNARNGDMVRRRNQPKTARHLRQKREYNWEMKV